MDSPKQSLFGRLMAGTSPPNRSLINLKPTNFLQQSGDHCTSLGGFVNQQHSGSCLYHQKHFNPCIYKKTSKNLDIERIWILNTLKNAMWLDVFFQVTVKTSPWSSVCPEVQAADLLTEHGPPNKLLLFNGANHHCTSVEKKHLKRSVPKKKQPTKPSQKNFYLNLLKFNQKKTQHRNQNQKKMPQKNPIPTLGSPQRPFGSTAKYWPGLKRRFGARPDDGWINVSRSDQSRVGNQPRFRVKVKIVVVLVPSWCFLSFWKEKKSAAMSRWRKMC